MIHEPHGCFDQVSSTTFPMVFAIDYLNLQPMTDINKRKIARAKVYLLNGYKKLLKYECTNGGFEMFGSSPAEEYLTAYGYFQFTQFMKVYIYIYII